MGKTGKLPKQQKAVMQKEENSMYSQIMTDEGPAL